MHTLTRRRAGFTIAELLVAMVMFGLIGATITKVLLTDQRLYQAHTQRVDLQQNLRSAADIFGAELRQLDASEGDILQMASDSIKIHSILIYYEGSTASRSDDTWLMGKLTAVTAQNCPNGSAGQRLTFALTTSEFTSKGATNAARHTVGRK